MTLDAVIFAVRDIVYLRVNASERGIVTGILFRDTGVIYYVTFGAGVERSHFGFELTKEKTEAESPA